MAENYEKFFFRKNVRYLVKFQYFELYFFCANILILIVLTDSAIKIKCYMRLCGLMCVGSILKILRFQDF